MKKGVTALVDLDPLVYAAGYSAEEHHYILNWVDVNPFDESPENDVEHFARFQSAWRRDAFRDMLNMHPDEGATHLHVVPRPKSHALRIVNDWVDRIRMACEGFVAELGLELDGVEGYLTGKGNFRETIATIKPYKGNRDRNKRPYWYSEIRRHLIQHHEAIVTQGYEADDALAIRQWGEDVEDPRTIICTIDKDLKMVPGLHYNYGTMQSRVVSHQEARHSFWLQVLTGDGSDNIPGLYMIGDAKAAKILPKYTSDASAFAAVLGAYEANIAKYPEKHAPQQSALGSLTENARLLWMMTHEDDLWTPPGQPAESLRAYLDAVGPVTDPDEDWL